MKIRPYLSINNGQPVS